MLVADKTTKLQTNNPHVSDDGHNPVTIFQSNLFILLLSVFTVCSPVPSWITVFAMDQFSPYTRDQQFVIDGKNPHLDTYAANVVNM